MENTATIARLFATLPLRLRKERAKDALLLLHFDLSGEPAAQYSVQIAGGECRVFEGLTGSPDALLRTDSATYRAIEMGEMNPQTAFLTGLIEVSNVAVMIEFGKLFDPFKLEHLQQHSSAQLHRHLQQYPPTNSVPVPASDKSLPLIISRPPPSDKPVREGKGPLAGVCVLDISRLLPGPLAGKMLADMGAEVIKIEDPNAPDDTRNYPPFINNQQSVYYAALNAGKKSLALDLRKEADKAVFLQMVREADVVLESFRPGVLAQIGIDYQTLSQINPRIVLVSLTGYGQQSPYQHQAGHDLNYLAVSGLLGQNRQANGQPLIPNAQIADVAGGAYMAVTACLAALLHCEKTGKGDWVDVAMTDGLLPLLSLAIAEYRATGVDTHTGQTLLSGALPNYNVYECAEDGQWMALGALEPKFWARFCQAVDKPEWISRIVPNQPETVQTVLEVKQLFRAQSRSYWIALAAQNDMCLTPVNNLSDLLNEPHFTARQSFVMHEHPRYGPCKHLALPIRFVHTPLPEGQAAPLLGEYDLLKNLSN